MSTSISLFCPYCGTANAPKNTACFSCQQHLLSDSSQPTSPTSPRLLKPRYILLCLLGQRGMGAVYEAEDTELGNRRIALKEMYQRHLMCETVRLGPSFRILVLGEQKK